MKKKYRIKVEEGFKDIFNTETKYGSEYNHHSNSDSLITVVNEPLVKHQIIQLAKLCEEIPNNITLKHTGKGIYIEFW
ncbi:hypothetical protein [Wocania ichthyoenteri]|uniref:hypothetical protein n=1 Tax=Wocania ichthyoenteri TaxID=1230531 RepID=UPI00053E5799|nr:hypothetical protein [Wocania ichthyoenteri]